jgi:hypothetical protein
VLWLGHCVYTGLANHARWRDIGRVSLTTEYLRNVIGRHHLNAVRQAAIEIGYVDRDRCYRPGAFSQTYWILPPYDCNRLVRRPIANPGLSLSINRWRESRHRAMWQRIRRNDTPVDAKVCEHLWRNLQRVRIDADIRFDPAILSDHQVSAYQIAVEQLRQGELWFTVDNFGRIHTPLTCLPKVLRQHLTVNGRPLVNVDISESQPLFVGLALALVDARGQAEGQREQEGEEQRKRAGGGQRRATLPYVGHTMLDKNTSLRGGFDRKRLPADLRRYLELCEARRLYQAVADRLGRTREEAKHGVMVAFYDRPSHRNAVCAVLDEQFPTVTGAMRRIKEQDYRRLAHFTQRIESRFMFGRIVPRILAERPDLFVATIHDAILTTVGDEEFARQVMLDEFAQLGLSPQVKIDRGV